jgi:hypothetical protein
MVLPTSAITALFRRIHMNKIWGPVEHEWCDPLELELIHSSFPLTVTWTHVGAF